MAGNLGAGLRKFRVNFRDTAAVREQAPCARGVDPPSENALALQECPARVHLELDPRSDSRR